MSDQPAGLAAELWSKRNRGRQDQDRRERRSETKQKGSTESQNLACYEAPSDGSEYGNDTSVGSTVVVVPGTTSEVFRGVGTIAKIVDEKCGIIW